MAAADLQVRAMVFDVFGTVVDWRGSIAAEGQRWNAEKGLQVDWAAFADAWRAGYGPSMNRVRTGELPWTNLDALHAMTLETVLPQFGVTGLSDDEKAHLNRVWHRLHGWPDSPAGLARLKQRYTLATLSNGNVALLTNMAKFAGLPWDCILSAELFHHYKPDPEVYLGAAELLGLPPAQVMMVAAHLGDLRAAAALGLRTAYIDRPGEYGAGRQREAPAAGTFDFHATGLDDLASQLGL